MSPSGKVCMPMDCVMIMGNRKSFHDARPTKIPTVASAGRVSGSMICQ